MLQRAQDLINRLSDRVRTTVQVVADLAESVGVPSSVTSIFQRNDGQAWSPPEYEPPPQPMAAPPAAAPAPVEAGPGPKPAAKKAKTASKARSKRASKKRVVEGNKAKSAGVKPLAVDDEINGSTYLARIIWSLGVAQLEGLGPLRPADIARMVMARSPVSLEPPNVARYIRRSKPSCIGIAQKEGSSSFYKLNAQGKKLFEEFFGGK